MTTPNLPATVSEEYGTGYEDLDDEISAVPRIQISHKDGVFKDSLSGEEFATIIGVPLGVVKQRVMWDAEVSETPSKPLCKSNDAKTGFPNMDAEKDGGFPWSSAPGLDPNTQPKDEYDRIVIACDSCPFTTWGKNAKTGKPVPPPCKERHTYPFIYNRSQHGEGFQPPYMESGIVSFQGSGIRPSKLYIAGFKRARLPLYTGVVKVSLDMAKRGSVDYSIPKFQKIGSVPDDELVNFAQEWPEMREFLSRAPRPSEDGDPARGHGQSASQAAANAGVSRATVTTSTQSVVDAEVVDESVATPSQTAAQAIVDQASTQSQPSSASSIEDEELPF